MKLGQCLASYIAYIFLATSSVTSAERWEQCTTIEPSEGSNGLICSGALCERDCQPGWFKSPTTKVSCRKIEDENGVRFEWSNPLGKWFSMLFKFFILKLRNLISGPCVTCKDITPLKNSILQPPPCKINSKSQRVCSIKCAEGYHNFGLNEGKTGTKDRF